MAWKYSSCLITHHTVKTYPGSWGWDSCINFDTRWRWVVSFTYRSLYLRVTAPDTHLIGDWVDLRGGLDAHCPAVNWIPVVQPLASLYWLSYQGSSLLRILCQYIHRDMRTAVTVLAPIL